jgi:hypothetical protein
MVGELHVSMPKKDVGSGILAGKRNQMLVDHIIGEDEFLQQKSLRKEKEREKDV